MIAETPDLGSLAVSDKEFILQNGKPEDAAKVWDTIKPVIQTVAGAGVKKLLGL